MLSRFETRARYGRDRARLSPVLVAQQNAQPATDDGPAMRDALEACAALHKTPEQTKAERDDLLSKIKRWHRRYLELRAEGVPKFTAQRDAELEVFGAIQDYSR